jgi:hypothetical protein
MKRLLGLQEFDVIGRQLSLEGYKDWEIVKAACNIVMLHRIGILDRSVTAIELAQKAQEYFASYSETEESPCPPKETFVLKMIRDQVHADRLSRMA